MKKSKIKSLVILFLSLFLLIACNPDKSVLVIYGLKCEYRVNPLGIGREAPILQWKIKDGRRGAKQTAYQVIVADNINSIEHSIGNMWDSGVIESDQTIFIKYNGKPLESGKEYYWRVQVWDQDGKASGWSDVAKWEMGLLNPSCWEAKWVSRDSVQPCRSVYMRKDIDFGGKEVKRARAYVTGLGNYVLFINGKKVGNSLLTPGWTHYPVRLEYQVYDVAELFAPGANSLGAILGNMWWSGGLGWKGGQKYSNGPLKFLCQINIEFKDGSGQTIITDESWKWHNSPIVADNIYNGETFDANKVQKGWGKAGFDDSVWNDVQLSRYDGWLSGPYAPQLKVKEEVAPVNISEPASGEYVFDLGQNIVGWAAFKIKAEKGDTIKMRFAELLHNDGTVAQENLRSAEATDIVISNGEEFIWEPKFTYHGFRYVQVSGLNEKPTLGDLTGKVIYADVEFNGQFTCSNELINSINKNVRWGQRGNFYAAPTDCPQRDERLGWMGDAQIFAPTANFNMGLAQYWAKWMFDITDGQDKEGWVYDVNPPIVVGGPSKPGWGDAVVIIPWLSYQYFGDTRIIEDNYTGMKAWVDYMKSKSNNYIYIWEQPGNKGWNGYGDWIAVEPSPTKPIGTAYFYYSSKLLSEMAKVIGEEDDAKEYKMLADNIAKAYQKEYWDEEKQNYQGGTQTANLLPLAFGITPEELRGQVAKNIENDVLAHDVHPTTGFLGTGYILPMLSRYNNHGLAYEMITKTDYPSWGYMVKKGATTIWELWNSDTEPPDRMNSRNHFALGCVGEWMWNNVVGINICTGQPGFKRTIIKPRPVNGLNWAKGEYATNYGDIVIDWRVENGVFKMDLTVPPNTTALIELPGMQEGSKIMEGGKDISENEIEGILEIKDGEILVSAGSYFFEKADK